MSKLLHELIVETAGRLPDASALVDRERSLTYAALATRVEELAGALVGLGLSGGDRIGIYLPKQLEAVVTMFATAAAGCTFVPINPVLKAPQVGYILRDCDVRVLVTAASRLELLAAELAQSPALTHVVLVDEHPAPVDAGGRAVMRWCDLADVAPTHRVIDTDMVSIFYTSGSTGKPKGVVLSHRNMVVGAHSVASYLGNSAQDRLLAVLPFSFDYGFSQLSTAFSVGATAVLLEYLLPRDVVRAMAREKITGLAGVPPLWIQLADVPWPAGVDEYLRYMTNSGGAMPRTTLTRLRGNAPRTKFYLMYGLTEAFRSTYLPPEEADARPDSIGKAIPNAEILVLRPDGSTCGVNEPGELVHRGSLVALGYWNDPAKTAERFKPIPSRAPGLVIPELAVWSGDTARRDEQGYLYFVGRRDEMIKTSGYRVSPTEVEEAAYASGLVGDAVATGAPHVKLGQGIILIASPPRGATEDSDALLTAMRQVLPNYMMPLAVRWLAELPRNPNGKFDRPRLAEQVRELFAGTT